MELYVVVDVEIQRQKYRAMAVLENVTFDGEEARFEVNIFDFNQDIYGETVGLLVDRIRDMSKFDSVDQLVDQLKADEERMLGIGLRVWVKKRGCL